MKLDNIPISTQKVKDQIEIVKESLKDPLGRELARSIHWIKVEGLDSGGDEQYPIAIAGEGSPILLLHGFDSCFLEFRRIFPLLKKTNQLFVPDLYGFGFCPRPKGNNFGIDYILNYLDQVLKKFSNKVGMGLIGASMGGGLAVELARRNPDKINRVMLLSPAGLGAKKAQVPWPLNHLGACVLRNSLFRKKICHQAFADPLKNVGEAEEEIASIHLQVDGWQRSLAAFALDGGVSINCTPIPTQPLQVIYGAQDKIIPKDEKGRAQSLLKNYIEEINECGHLPHLEQPETVARLWLKENKI